MMGHLGNSIIMMGRKRSHCNSNCVFDDICIDCFDCDDDCEDCDDCFFDCGRYGYCEDDCGCDDEADCAFD